MAGALHDLEVLDLSSHLSGPYCTMMLADHGGILFGPVLATDQALTDPHVIVGEMITQVNYPATGETTTLGIVASFSRHPDRWRERRRDWVITPKN